MVSFGVTLFHLLFILLNLIADSLQADYSINTFSVSSLSDKGVTGAFNNYNLILERGANLDNHSLYFNDICALPSTSPSTAVTYYNIKESLFKQSIPLVVDPNYSKAFPSPGYRLDYYLYNQYNTFSSLSSLTYSTTYKLVSSSGNPYDYKFNSAENVCLPGIRLFNGATTDNSYGIIHLNGKFPILTYFNISFSIVNVNLDTYQPNKLFSSASVMYYNIYIVFHGYDTSNFFSAYKANGYDLSFLNKALVVGLETSTNGINNDSNNNIFLKVSRIDASGASITEGMILLKQKSDSFYKSIRLEMETFIIITGECQQVDVSLVNIKSSPITQFKHLMKVYIDNKLIVCVLMQIESIVDVDGLSSSGSSIDLGKANISLLSYLTDPKSQSLSVILSQLELITQATCGSAPLTISCGALVNNSLNVVNISDNPTEAIKFSYKSYPNQMYRECNADGSTSSIELRPGISNPFYERCSIAVAFPDIISDILISNSYGRTFSLNKIYNFQKYPSIRPLDLFDICVYSSVHVLKIGYCDCRICLKYFDLAKAYSVFNIAKCYTNFGRKCSCFDQSQINSAGTGFIFQTFDICTECKFQSQCSLNYPKATCSVPPYPNIILNPVVKGYTSSQDLSVDIDFGRVTDGKIIGDTCDCTKYDRNSNPYLDSSSSRSVYSAYYSKDSDISNDTTFKACIKCLFDTSVTLSDCDTYYCSSYKIPGIDYFTYPAGGRNCRLCLFSSELLQVISTTDLAAYSDITDCLQSSKDDYAHACNSLITSYGYDPTNIYLSQISHYRVECPSRPISTYGSVCMPLYSFNSYSVFSNNNIFKRVEWDVNVQCINSDCQVTSKALCSGSCVCYDTCPTGDSRFGDSAGKYYVPCSSKGVCTNTGICVCDYGYIYPNCQTHCSEMPGGCCLTDSDCQGLASFNTCIKTNEIGYCG